LLESSADNCTNQNQRIKQASKLDVQYMSYTRASPSTREQQEEEEEEEAIMLQHD
jgi:hypothetical protein